MVNVVNKIVVPGKPAIEAGLAVLPFRQIHYHSTGNPNSSMQNEVDYLRNHWQGAYYTHLVGIDENGNAAAWQVAAVNGGAYDVGGDWNWEGYAAIEFVEGSITTQEQFNKAYVVYIALGRQLAQEAGIPMTIDTPDNSGNKTHNYASATGHGSDHVDPIPFLAKWGVSRDKFNRDLVNGVGDDTTVTPQPASTNNQPAASSIQAFKNVGNHFENTKSFKIDYIFKDEDGDYQAISNWLAGGADADKTLNGIPLAILDNVTRGNNAPTQNGDYMKFAAGYDNGTIDEYDPATNGVGIVFGKYGIIWFNADAFIQL